MHWGSCPDPAVVVVSWQQREGIHQLGEKVERSLEGGFGALHTQILAQGIQDEGAQHCHDLGTGTQHSSDPRVGDL